MSQISAGWYPDPTGRFPFRYWNGGSWTAHAGRDGQTIHDPVDPAPSPSEDDFTSAVRHAAEPRDVPERADPEPQETVVEHAGDAPADGSPGAPASGTSGFPAGTVIPEATTKVTTFNAKKVATRLQEHTGQLADEVGRLRGLLDDLGVLEEQDRRRRIEEYRAEEAQLSQRVQQLQQEAAAVEGQLVVNRDRVNLEELGLFDFEHPAESSAQLGSELESVRSAIRNANKAGQAITATQGFTFNNSAAQGRKFVGQMSKIMLRAYNAEAENAVKTVKAGNLDSAQRRLSKAREQIAKQGTMIDLAVSDHYHRLRLRELELAARHLQAKAAEKEVERERRAELREQKALEAEIKREKERLEKERTHYLNSIQRLRDAGDTEAADALQAELDRIDAEIADVDYRAANIRAGYVYVISNIGAFGEGVVKIGMTRRLDPMDRVRELGDASVPFRFDVHALFFSEDAVEIEAMLHREFAHHRVNRVNQRKEFFRVRPEQVLEVLRAHNVSILEFDTHSAAEEFRMSAATT